MSPALDVLGLGCVAVDDLLFVPSYPAADTKVRILRRDRQCGGLAATALVAAARLGAHSAYAGTLGDDELSRFVLGRFQAERVDTSFVRRREGVRPIHSIIVVDESADTRTILYDLDGAVGAEPDWPAETAIRASRVLFVDHFGVEGMTRAARIARSAGIPVVADFERSEFPGFEELFALADHLIVSDDFARQRTGHGPEQAVCDLWSAERSAVVVTCGAAGAWYLDGGGHGTPRHQPAFRVTVVDTTGCGDVFHGAYAASLAHGTSDLARRVRFAAAAAALKATQPGGQTGIPTQVAVERFLEEQPS